MLQNPTGGRPIGQRMALVLGAVLLIAFTGSGIGYGSLRTVNAETQAMLTNALVSERLAADWYRNITNGVNRTSAIAISTDPALAQFFTAAAAESTKQSSELQKRLDELMDTPAERALFDKLSAARKEYLSTRDAVTEAKKAGEPERAREVFDTRFQPAAAAFQAAIQAVMQDQRTQLDEAAKRVDVTNRNAQMALIAFGVCALLVGGALSLWLSRSITGPLREAVSVAEAIASFNLTSRITPRSNDETGQLLRSLSSMQGSLQRLISEVRSSTDSIGTASAEIASGNMDLSSRTEQTASNLQQAAASMMQLTGTVRQTAESAATANQLARSAAEVAQRGGTVVAQVVSTMDEISTSSRRIGDIIGTIDGIAFQTNLLALNAAVEAARAGEAGRGFAVVASEVRALAQRASTAAREIKGLVSDSVGRIESGTAVVTQAGAAVDEIVVQALRINDMLGEIARSAREQAEEVQQSTQAIQAMDAVTQQNAALVEETAAAAAAMKEQAEVLAAEVAAFQIG